MAAKDSAPAAINKRAGEVQRNLKNRRWRGVRARQQTERIQSCLHLTKSIPDVSIDAKQGVFFPHRFHVTWVTSSLIYIGICAFTLTLQANACVCRCCFAHWEHVFVGKPCSYWSQPNSVVKF